MFLFPEESLEAKLEEVSKLSIGDPKIFRKAVTHLRRKDPRLGWVIENHGMIEFTPSGGMFDSLVESIIGQQLAGAAANAIISRVKSLYGAKGLDPVSMHRTPNSKLRKAGVSPQKIRYLKDLSSRVVHGELELESLRNEPDEVLLDELDKVLGVGPWTVHMILIFTLGRPNVLPVDDLGIKKAIQQLYSLRELPKKEEIVRLAEAWHPYCSVASLYLWRYKDSPAREQ